MNTIEEAIEDLISGKVICVLDDEDRENEGDLIAPSEFCTPEMVNFMSTHGKGLICVAIDSDRANDLELEEMVRNNSGLHETKFTVSVDFLHGTSTGISARDRAATIRSLANSDTKPSDLGRPGHIFPLIAVGGGVLRRPGHTEATVDLMKLSGLKPSGVLCEIINEDGTMARRDDIQVFAKKHDLKIITVKDLIAHRLKSESLIEKTSSTEIKSIYGDFVLHTYKNVIDDKEHIALVKGSWDSQDTVLVRAHSEDLTEKIFRTLNNSDESHLRRAFKMIKVEGRGILLYLNHSGYNTSLASRVKAMASQDENLNMSQFYQHLGIEADPRDYGIGAQILSDLGVRKMKIITNSPKKRVGIDSFGIEVVGTVAFE